jgi:hypothetical protein
MLQTNMSLAVVFPRKPNSSVPASSDSTKVPVVLPNIFMATSNVTLEVSKSIEACRTTSVPGAFEVSLMSFDMFAKDTQISVAKS